jgi:hypothetical protein
MVSAALTSNKKGFEGLEHRLTELVQGQMENGVRAAPEEEVRDLIDQASMHVCLPSLAAQETELDMLMEPTINLVVGDVHGLSSRETVDLGLIGPNALGAETCPDQEMLAHLPAWEKELFDLNVPCNPITDRLGDLMPLKMTDVCVDNVLGAVDARLNKEPRDQASSKAGVRGMARFDAPLKKAMLCNPPPRARTTQKKERGDG